MPQGKRVLVVDDNKDTVTTTVAMLQEMGHQAQGCHNGQDALSAIASYNPDVVLLDIAMPGISGWQVAQSIRERFEERPMLIAITGEYTTEADRILSRMSGFNFYLIKPADPKVLERLIAGDEDSAVHAA